MQNLIFILVLLLIGKCLSYAKDFPEDTFKAFASYIIYVSLPALILVQVPRLELSADVLAPIVMPWAMLGVSAALVWALARRFRWDRSTTGALLLVVPLGNTSFLGIPMVEAFFGPDAIPYAVIYDQLGTFLALATYGSFVVALYSGSDRQSAGGVIRRVATFPPFLALVLAFATRSSEYPVYVSGMLKSLAGTLVPVVMIAVGFKLSFRIPRETLGPLGFGLATKLCVAPLIALVACRILGLESEAVRVAIFEAGMPSQISAGAVAIMAGLAPELVAAMVGFGIVISFATLSGLYLLM